MSIGKIEYHEVNHPLEQTNRAVFEFNRVLDEAFYCLLRERIGRSCPCGFAPKYLLH